MKLLYDLVKQADPQAPALQTAAGQGYTYGQLWEAGFRLAQGLMAHGLERGECVAIYSAGRPEWNVVDLAIQMVGGVVVSLFPGASKSDQEYILNQTGARYLFVGNQAFAVLAEGIRAQCPKLEHIVRMDEGSQGAESISSWMGYANSQTKVDLEARMEMNEADQLVTIMYTSGTSGKPNGVMHSHATFLAGVMGMANAFPGNQKGWIAMSLLSTSHCYERASQYVYFSKQMCVVYADVHKPLIHNLEHIRPHAWAAVPALLQQLVDSLKVRNAKTDSKYWALLDHYAANHHSIYYRWQHLWADRRLFRKLRQQLGGRLERITSSGAALSPKLEATLWGMGIRTFQIYGTTETVPVTASSPIYGHRLGSSGPQVPGWQVRLNAEGEVEVKCPSCMLGIYKNPELTNQILTPDGWYRTGDLGRLEDDRFLYLEGRRSDTFKLSNGRYVSATRVESALAKSSMIGHALVQGPNQQHLTALLHINPGSIDPAILESSELLRTTLAAEVERLWNNLYPHEPPIKHFDWILDDWTIESGAYTPTLKLKRKALIERYKQQFNLLSHVQ